jgi:hypothetical protein
MDLVAMPSKTLPAGTTFRFTVPSVLATDGSNYAFTADTMKCLVGAEFAPSTDTVSATIMRERYYASLEGGSLSGDGETPLPLLLRPFDNYVDGSVSPIVPVTQVLLDPIVTSTWGQNAFSSFTTMNNTAGHESILATLTMKPHNLPISARGHVSFAFPTGWTVEDVTAGSPASTTACVASVEGNSDADAEISGKTVMSSADRSIAFYPGTYVKPSLNGEFRLFCSGITIPMVATAPDVIVVAAQDVAIPFNWAPAAGSRYSS